MQRYDQSEPEGMRLARLDGSRIRILLPRYTYPAEYRRPFIPRLLPPTPLLLCGGVSAMPPVFTPQTFILDASIDHDGGNVTHHRA